MSFVIIIMLAFLAATVQLLSLSLNLLFRMLNRTISRFSSFFKISARHLTVLIQGCFVSLLIDFAFLTHSQTWFLTFSPIAITPLSHLSAILNLIKLKLASIK